MTKVVIYSNSSLDSFYDQTLEYLKNKYHNDPTTLYDQPLSMRESERISYYDGLGQDLINHHFPDGGSHQRNSNQNDSFSIISGNLNLGKAVF